MLTQPLKMRLRSGRSVQRLVAGYHWVGFDNYYVSCRRKHRIVSFEAVLGQSFRP